MEVIFQPYLRYADFSGRARRTEYWLYSLLNGAILIFLFAGFFGSMTANRGISGMSTGALNFLTVFVFWWAATILPTLAVSVRRLHDANMSGAFFFVHFIPFFGGLIFLGLMVMNGSNGPNRYGADPRGGGNYWWEGNDGPPEGHPQIARTTRNREENSAPATAGGFGRRSTGAAQAQAFEDDSDDGRAEWMRRLNGG